MHKISIDNFVGKFFKNAFDHRLDSGEHILLFNKAHLKIELVEFARATIGAAIFIAKTRGNLKITVKAANHDQLFKLLRCLRQSIEFARVKAGGHQKIARAFRR